MERYGEESTNMYHSYLLYLLYRKYLNYFQSTLSIRHYRSLSISRNIMTNVKCHCYVLNGLSPRWGANFPLSSRRSPRSPRSPCAQLGIRGAVAVAVAALMWAARIAASNAWRKPRKHSGNTPLPSVCIYTPRASYTFPAVGPVGGTGGQGRRRKEVSSRFIDYDFWLSADMGGTCFAPAQNNIWQTPKMYSFGGWAASMKYQLMAS